MSAAIAPTVSLVALIIFTVTPLVLGVLAARSNVRRSRSRVTERLFWGISGPYFGLFGLVGLALIAVVSRPQVEGLLGFCLFCLLGFLGLPSSILPLLLAYAVVGGDIARPVGLSSMSVWFVISTLCWQFFLIVGIRWLSTSPGRHKPRVVDGVTA